MEQKCIKQLGILAVNSACPNGCRTVEEATVAILENNCSSRESRNRVAQVIAEIQCPEANLMIFPKGSCRMRS